MKSFRHLTAFIFFVLCLNATTHAEGIHQKPSGGKAPVEVVRTENLIIYYPSFARIDLVTGKMPSKTDEEVIFCCAAAFTGERLTEFRHSNIAGHHVSGGEYHQGYKCGVNNGLFTWSKKSGWRFYNYAHANSVTPLKKAASEKGMGFGQSLLVNNKREMTGCKKAGAKNHYRALCSLDGRLCIIDSKNSITFKAFKTLLIKQGVTYAMYCDMGTGWNYSWYRDKEGKAVEIHSIPGKYTTNWITFYSK